MDCDGDVMMVTLVGLPCPNHEGAYDCTPFCAICEGNQEYDKKVEVDDE